MFSLLLKDLISDFYFSDDITSKRLTVRRASDSISLRTRKSDKVICKWLQSHHALQTSSVTTQRSNVFRWPHILQKSDLHKAICSTTHPPKVRLYDLRVTSDDLVSLMGALRYFLGKHLRPPPLKTTLSEWSLCRNKYPL